MKKTMITIGADEEKLAALKIYLKQKGQTVEGELEKAFDALFAKSVPSGVRDYLDLRAGITTATLTKPRKEKQSLSSAVGAPEADSFR